MHRFGWYRVDLVRVATVAVALLSVGALGCPKHENLPTAPDYVTPPTPTNFVITLVDAQLNPPEYTYDFSWAVSNANQVDHYRLYVLGGGVIPDQLLFETPNTTFPYTFDYSLAGLQFAVSAVSPDGIEGQGRVAIAQ